MSKLSNENDFFKFQIRNELQFNIVILKTTILESHTTQATVLPIFKPVL